MAKVWIATGDTLMCITPKSARDDINARTYMRAYNTWLQHRTPILLEGFEGVAVFDANGIGYSLQHDRHRVSRIDRKGTVVHV